MKPTDDASIGASLAERLAFERLLADLSVTYANVPGDRVVGIDTRTPVDDSYKLPFRFTGKINKLTYNLGKEQMTAEERGAAQKALASARD